MINIILIVLLILGTYSGARRGLIVQAINTAGYFITLLAAYIFYTPLARILSSLIPYPSDTQATQLALFNLLKNVEFDVSFYKGLSFALIMAVGWLVTRLISASLNQVARLPLLHQVNYIGGALLGFICNWLGLFFILSLLAMVPVDAVQGLFTGNSLATFIVKQTPIVSQMVLDTWLTYK